MGEHRIEVKRKFFTIYFNVFAKTLRSQVIHKCMGQCFGQFTYHYATPGAITQTIQGSLIYKQKL